MSPAEPTSLPGQQKAGSSKSGGASAPPRLFAHSDFWVAIVLLGFCAAAYWVTLGFDEVPQALMEGMGPDRFPQLVIGMIALLGILLIWQSRDQTDEVRERVDPMVYGTLVLMSLFMGLLEVIGLLAAGFVLTVVLGRIWGERRWGLLLASAGGLTGVIYLAFVKGLKIPFPTGLLGSLLFG